MAAEKHGGYTTFIDLPEAVMLDNLCGGHKQMTQMLRLIHNRARYKALCPFHDDHHASLSFSVHRNSYRCFVCGASGGPIDLVMKYLGKDFSDYYLTRK
jgi:hypothetical protein